MLGNIVLIAVSDLIGGSNNMWNPWYPFLGRLYAGYIIISVISAPILLCYGIYYMIKKIRERLQKKTEDDIIKQ